MAIDLSENGNGFNDLRGHIGHKIVVVGYGQAGDTEFSNVAIECEDCGCVLVDFNEPEISVEDFVELAREYVYNVYPKFEAEDVMEGLEEVGGKPKVQSLKEAVESVKVWGMKRNEFLDMTNRHNTLKKLWDSEDKA